MRHTHTYTHTRAPSERQPKSVLIFTVHLLWPYCVLGENASQAVGVGGGWSRQIERLMLMGGSEERPKVSPFGNAQAGAVKLLIKTKKCSEMKQNQIKDKTTQKTCSIPTKPVW